MMEFLLTVLFFYILFCSTLFVIWTYAYRSLYPNEDITLGDLTYSFGFLLIPVMNVIVLSLLVIEAVKNLASKRGWSEKVVLKGKVPKR